MTISKQRNSYVDFFILNIEAHRYCFVVPM